MTEAMQKQFTIIASNLGAAPEIITDGAKGVIVHPFDAAALSHAKIGLVQNREKSRVLAFNAKVAADQRYTPSTVAENFAKNSQTGAF